ncbi:hypothetical protein DSECCO2_568300 [anaerobic digester metagenome]
MNNHIVLNIYIAANADGMHIAADDRIEPHRAVVAHDHVAGNGGIFSYHAIGAKFGQYPFHFFDQCHQNEFLQRYESIGHAA